MANTTRNGRPGTPETVRGTPVVPTDVREARVVPIAATRMSPTSGPHDARIASVGIKDRRGLTSRVPRS